MQTQNNSQNKDTEISKEISPNPTKYCYIKLPPCRETPLGASLCLKCPGGPGMASTVYYCY